MCLHNLNLSLTPRSVQESHPHKLCKIGCSSIPAPSAPKNRNLSDYLMRALFVLGVAALGAGMVPRPANAQDVAPVAVKSSAQAWVDAVMEARKTGGMYYSFQVDEIAERLAAKCARRGRRESAPQFVWLGRIASGGVPVKNVIISPRNSRMSDCFVQAIKRTKFPEPPQAQYFDREGGHPVAWQWEPPHRVAQRRRKS